MPVRIVTDSSCDLEAAEASELGVEIVPLSIRFGTDEYTDRVDLAVEDFYAKMAASDELPETSAPSPGAFEAAFRRQLDAGADAIVCINLSSGLSATMQAAENAATAIKDDVTVHVVDSQSITAGLGTMVRTAARAAADGADAETIIAAVQDLVPRSQVIGTLDTLENLKKGGRVGGAKAVLGSLLSIKPLIHFEDGVVAEAGKARTRRKALEWVRDQIFERSEVEHLVVIHSMAPDVDDLLDLLAPRYDRDKIAVTTIGAVIGTHGGARMLGATWVDPADQAGAR
ncbi:MAG TPA: DegV family protein [Acidimicrobiales bacterium]|jgi:DegV family protein with EDD domain|nr:DegV family protein [Acidimicrobiales bacterium]